MSDYGKSVNYNTFDVTSLIEPGKENTIGAVVGNGLFFAPRNPGLRHFGYPRLLAQLEITYGDGSVQTVVSDGTWKVSTDGPIRANNYYDGEEYDSRKEIPGWAEPGFSENPSTDIFSGLPFKSSTGSLTDQQKESDFRSYIADLDEKGKADASADAASGSKNGMPDSPAEGLRGILDTKTPPRPGEESYPAVMGDAEPSSIENGEKKEAASQPVSSAMEPEKNKYEERSEARKLRLSDLLDTRTPKPEEASYPEVLENSEGESLGSLLDSSTPPRPGEESYPGVLER